MTPRPQGIAAVIEGFAPWVLALALGVTLVASAPVEPALASLTQLTVAVCAALLVAALTFFWSRNPLPAAVWVIGLPAAVMLVRAVSTAPMRYSIVGLRSIPQGAALWLVGWLWVALFALGRSAKTARLTTAVVAVIGAVSGSVGLWQEWTQVLSERYAGSASSEAIGLFGSSNALGQFALIAIACSVAWFAVSRSLVTRVAAAGCAALSLAGLAVSVSRGSWAAAVIGVAVAWIVTRKSKPALLAGGLVGGATAGAVALFAASAGAFGEGVMSRLNSALNGRPVIWDHALLQWSRAFAFGEGPARFGTYAEWTASKLGLDGVDAYGTFDPHSVPLAFAVAGGLVALAALLVAVGFAAFTLARRVSNGTSLAQAALLGGVAALGLTFVIEIAEVASLVAGAAVLGLLLSGGSGASREGRDPDTQSSTAVLRRYIAPSIACLVALSMTIPLTAALSNATSYRQLEKSNAADTAAALDYWTRTGDPSYATDHLGPLLGAAIDGTQPGLSDDAHLLATSLEPANEWFIDAARMSALAWSLPGPQAPQGDERKMRSAIDAGRAADPGNDELWDTVEKNDAAMIAGWAQR